MILAIKVYSRKPQVTLYGQCDYYGWVSSPLIARAYTRTQLEALQVINNDASSIEVPAGWTATLYDGENFSGDSAVVTADVRCSAGFDNRVSSLKIKDH